MKTINITQETITESLKYFFNELNKIITPETNTIITNANIASVLQDSVDYKVCKTTDDSNKTKNYIIGTFNESRLFVDPQQSWIDNRIILKKDNKLVDEINVNDENGNLI